MSLDKIAGPNRIRHWLGDMEADYIYTLGIAGERFFKEIKEKGKIMGAKCSCCNITYVPARMYCEKCFSKLDKWVDVGAKGTIHTFTIAAIDMNERNLQEPVIYALIKFPGTHGGLIHRINGIAYERITIGMKVEAVFKPQIERRASINDIEHFRPAE